MAVQVGQDLDDTFLEHMRRSDGSPAPNIRVLLLRGARGYGKTYQLAHVGTSLRRTGVPSASFDIGVPAVQDGERQIGPLLAALAWKLGRRIDDREPPQFPRLIAANVAMDLTLGRIDRRRARRELVEGWLRHNGMEARWRFLGSLAGSFLEQPLRGTGVDLSLPERLGDAAVLGIRRFTQQRLPSELRWFAQPTVLGEAPKDDEEALEALCDLSVQAHDTENPRSQQEVSRLLMLAFLADLKSAFEAGGGRRRRNNAALLLDNAGSRLGRRFLNRLAQAQAELSRRNASAEIPLSVVATTRQDLLRAFDGSDNDATDQKRRLLAGWRQIELDPLTGPDVSSLATTVIADGSAELVAAVSYQLSRGHPAASDLLVRSRRWRPCGFEPSVLLTEYSGEFEAQLLDALLPANLEAGAISQLSRCAVARDPVAADELLRLRLSGDDDLVGNRLEEIHLWDEDLRPTLVRRLLLRRLAESGSGPDSSWTLLHERLARRGLDVPYYLVGAGDLRLAASLLAGRLLATAGQPTIAAGGQESEPGQGLDRWLDELRHAADAPRATRPPGTTALEQARALRSAERQAPVRRPIDMPPQLQGDVDRPPEIQAVQVAVLNLLSTLVIAQDPLSQVRRSGLHRSARTAYTALEAALEAVHRPDLRGVIRRREHHHEDAQNWWENWEAEVPQPASADLRDSSRIDLDTGTREPSTS